MANPFQNIDSAFLPMFFETCEISGKRKNNETFKTSVRCCTFPEERVDPFSDTQEASELLQMSLYVMKKCDETEDGWNLSYKPQIGDTVKLENDTVWKITEVREVQSWFDIKVRN